MSLPIIIEGKIVALRMRMNWRGRPVLQCQRETLRARSVPGPLPRLGATQWRDVRRADAFDVERLLRELSPESE